LGATRMSSSKWRKLKRKKVMRQIFKKNLIRPEIRLTKFGNHEIDTFINFVNRKLEKNGRVISILQKIES
jgi:hypothetical protein